MPQPIQGFTAPGDPDLPLPVAYPPWMIDRSVYLPLWDWQLILDEASRRDPARGSLLRRVSGGVHPDDEMRQHLTDEELSDLVDFLQSIATEFAAGVDLTEQQHAVGVGDFDSTAYARMLLAVREILLEARRRQEPFEAWNE